MYNVAMDNNNDFQEYDGMTPNEVMNTFIVGVGTHKDFTVPQKQAIIIFLKMILNEPVEPCYIIRVYEALERKEFQQIFVLVIGALILALQHIEAYELLAHVKKIINKISSHKLLRYKDFWGELPIVPDHLRTKSSPNKNIFNNNL